MYEFHPYFTLDGSVGLYSPEYNDIYHSATGALTEACEKFIMPIDFDLLLKKDSIKVLDICYGIGYNSKSFLNEIFEKFFEKNFAHAKKNSAPIYTNNHLGTKTNNCNEPIYDDNIFDKISITAVDNDKILSYLSPFIKTGEKNIRNEKFDFEYQIIEKYLKSGIKMEKRKINKLINFLIFEKILENTPEILDNRDIAKILNSPQYSRYFENDMRGIYGYLKSKADKNNPNIVNQGFLHNIYYNHISKSYKRDLKRYNLGEISFNLKTDDAREVLKHDNNTYNLIFLDAFTPSKCPCLWSLEFFKLLYNRLCDDGMLLTYSRSASIRSAMIEAGFYIGEIFNQRENKFTGTIAVKKPDLIKQELSEFDLGLLKTSSGIFYRDENLTDQNEAILERRNLEVKNSHLMSSSQYNKNFKKL